MTAWAKIEAVMSARRWTAVCLLGLAWSCLPEAGRDALAAEGGGHGQKSGATLGQPIDLLVGGG